MKNLVLSVCIMFSFLMNAQVDSTKTTIIENTNLIEAQNANESHSNIIFQVPELITNFNTAKGKLRNRSQSDIYFKCYENNDMMKPVNSLLTWERWNSDTKIYEAVPVSIYRVGTTQFRLFPRQNQSIQLNTINSAGIYRYVLHITRNYKKEKTSSMLYSNTFVVEPMKR